MANAHCLSHRLTAADSWLAVTHSASFQCWQAGALDPQTLTIVCGQLLTVLLELFRLRCWLPLHKLLAATHRWVDADDPFAATAATPGPATPAAAPPAVVVLLSIEGTDTSELAHDPEAVSAAERAASDRAQFVAQLELLEAMVRTVYWPTTEPADPTKPTAFPIDPGAGDGADPDRAEAAEAGEGAGADGADATYCR